MLRQHLEVFSSTQGASLDISAGTRGEFSIGIGLVLSLALVVYILVVLLIRHKDEKKEWRIAGMSAGLGLVALWMTTYLFPWNGLANHAGPFRSVIASIQFPWRFSSIAGLCMVLLWCAIITILANHFGNRLPVVVSSAAVLLSLVSVTYFFIDLYTHSEKITITTIEDMNSYVWSGDEYLPTNVDLDDLKEKLCLTNDALQVGSDSRRGTTIEFYCSNTTDSIRILDVPLLYYKGYQARGTYTDGRTCIIPVSAGSDGVIQITVPAESSLQIQVKFIEPWYWRMAEVISMFFLLGIVLERFISTRRQDLHI